MKQTTSFNSYLTKIIIISILFVCLPMAFSSMATDTTSSYIASCICFFLITLVGSKLVLGENIYVGFYALAFIIQLLIGLVHYLYFVDEGYFSTNGVISARFWHEYSSSFDAIQSLQEARRGSGIFYWMSASDYQGTHSALYHILSFPFYFLGHRWLNYEPLNIFSSLMTSCNIMFLYKQNYAENKAVYKSLLFWTAFFPTFLLADTLWRDAFGIYLISVGLVLVSLSKNILSKVLSYVLFGCFSFMQRTVYVVLAAASAFWGNITRTKSAFVKVLFAVLGVFAIYYTQDIVESANAAEYTAGYVNLMSYLALPIKIIFGMIGPFPWTNFFKAVEIDPAYAWQLQDYLMGTFQFGYLMAIISKWRVISFKKIDSMTLMGFGVMLSGFISKQMHIGYISEGLLFTLPWFFSQIGVEYKKYFKYSFVILILLNVVLLVIGSQGFSNIWK